MLLGYLRRDWDLFIGFSNLGVIMILKRIVMCSDGGKNLMEVVLRKNKG